MEAGASALAGRRRRATVLVVSLHRAPAAAGISGGTVAEGAPAVDVQGVPADDASIEFIANLASGLDPEITSGGGTTVDGRDRGSDFADDTGAAGGVDPADSPADGFERSSRDSRACED